MIGRRLLAAAAFVLASPAMDALAAPQAGSPEGPQAGDCAIFREGGSGRVFKAPTYWLKGTVGAVYAERRVAGRCPRIGKPLAAYTRDDWVRIAASTPCVERDADVREVDVLRIRFVVDEWETPWSSPHGSTGWLFRGHFLDRALKKGEILDMDASWLEHCAPRP